MPKDPARLQRMKERLWARYPIDAFNLVRCVRVGGSNRSRICLQYTHMVGAHTTRTQQLRNHSKGFDPKGVLSNDTISAFFDEPPQQQQQQAKKKAAKKQA